MIKLGELIRRRGKGLALLMILVVGACFNGCGKEDTTATDDKEITVVSREEGSGTRDSFTTTMGIAENGEDLTVDSAEISNSTAVVIQSVAGNEGAIGYASLGNIDNSVKVVDIDGIEANEDNIKSGDYKLTRSFKIVTSKESSDLAKDFVEFIMSSEGQETIEDEGYIGASSVDKSKDDDKSSESSKTSESKSASDTSTEVESYEKKDFSGKINIAGSTSVAPLIEILADKYEDYYDDVDIEVQQTGSSAGIQSLGEGTCDLAILSRDLTDDEKGDSIEDTDFAIDGIVVIVNKWNDIDDISSTNIKKIFTGKITSWNQLEE